MHKILITAALATVLLSSVAQAYTESRTCDKDEIETELTNLWENGAAGKAGTRVVYIKSASESSRKANELRCSVVVVTNVMTVSGVFRFFNQDGHSLVGFEPGRIVK